jgi:DNA polymerase elongation subunit (family B)
MKILLYDIETSFNTAQVFDIWDQNIPLQAITKVGHTICWAAKWYGSRRMAFDSIHQSTQVEMLQKIHALIDEADAVVHYNGTKFDQKTLAKDFLLNGFLRSAACG